MYIAYVLIDCTGWIFSERTHAIVYLLFITGIYY